MKLSTYYVLVIRRAFNCSLDQVGFKNRVDIIRNLVIWAATVLVLYEIGWARVPLIGAPKVDPSSEVRFGLSALAAILLLFSLSFAFNLLRTPFTIFLEAKSEAEKMRFCIASKADEEHHRLTLSQLRREGFAIYNREFDAVADESFFEWRASMEAWAEKIRLELKRHWSISALHDFDDPGSYGGWTKMMKNRERTNQIENREKWLLPRYSSYFKNLDDLVRYGSQKFLGQAVVESAALQNEPPSSLLE